MENVPLPGMIPVSRITVEFLIDADGSTIYVDLSSHHADGSLHSKHVAIADDSPARACASALNGALALLEEHVSPF